MSTRRLRSTRVVTSFTTAAAPVKLFTPKRLRATPTPTFAPVFTLRQTPKVSRPPPVELISIRTTPPYLHSTSTSSSSPTALFTTHSTPTSLLTTPIFTPPFVIPTSDISETPVEETSTAAVSLTTPVFTPPFVIPTSPPTIPDLPPTESSTRKFTSSSSSTPVETSITESSTSSLSTTRNQETSEVVREETSKEPLSSTVSTSASQVSGSSTKFSGSSVVTGHFSYNSSSEPSSLVDDSSPKSLDLTVKANTNSTSHTVLNDYTSIITTGTSKVHADATSAYSRERSTETSHTSPSVFQETTTPQSTGGLNERIITSASLKSEASSVRSTTEISTSRAALPSTSSSRDVHVSTFDWLEVTDFSTNRNSSRTDTVATSYKNTTQVDPSLAASQVWLYGLIFSLIFISLLLLTLFLTVLWRAYLRHYWSAFITSYCCVECCPRNTGRKPVTSSNGVLRGFPRYLVDPMAVGHPNWIVKKTPDNQSLITMSNGRPITVKDSEGEKLLETSNPQFRTVIKIPGSITYQLANRGEIAMFGAPPNVSSISKFSSPHAGAVISKPRSFNNTGFQNTTAGIDPALPVSYYPFANYPANLYFSENPGYLMPDNYPYNPRYLADNRTPSAPGPSVQKRSSRDRKLRRLYPSLTTPGSLGRPPTYSAIINASDMNSALDVPDSGRKGPGGRGRFGRMFGRSAKRRPSYLDIQEESVLVDEDVPDHSRLLNRNNNNNNNNGKVTSHNNNCIVRFLAVSDDPRSLVFLNNKTEGMMENSREAGRKKTFRSEGVTEFRISDGSRFNSNHINSTRKIGEVNGAVSREKIRRISPQIIELVDRTNPPEISAVVEIPPEHPTLSIGQDSGNNSNNNNNSIINDNDIPGFKVKKSTAKSTPQTIVVLDRSHPSVSTSTEEPLHRVKVDVKNKDFKQKECEAREMIPLMAWGSDVTESADPSQQIPRLVVPPEVQPVTQSVIQPLFASVIQPKVLAMDQSMVQPTAQQVATSTVQPKVSSMVQPTLQSTVKPTVHSTVQLKGHPTLQSMVESTVQPTVHSTIQLKIHPMLKSTVQPIVQPISSGKTVTEFDKTFLIELERTIDNRVVVENQ